MCSSSFLNSYSAVFDYFLKYFVTSMRICKRISVLVLGFSGYFLHIYTLICFCWGWRFKVSAQESPSFPELESKVPFKTRQLYVNLFFSECLKICSTKREALDKVCL